MKNMASPLIISLFFGIFVAYYFFYVGQIQSQNSDKDTIEHSNDLYIVTGVSGAGKSSFIGTLCQNQNEIRGSVGCEKSSFTNQFSAYECANKLVFGNKIVKIIDTPGLHDSFGRDQYFIKQLQDELISQQNFIPYIKGIFVIEDVSMARNQIQISINYLKEIFKLNQTQITDIKQSILFILNKAKISFFKEGQYQLYVDMFKASGYAFASFNTIDFCEGKRQNIGQQQERNLRKKVDDIKIWELQKHIKANNINIIQQELEGKKDFLKYIQKIEGQSQILIKSYCQGDKEKQQNEILFNKSVELNQLCMQQQFLTQKIAQNEGVGSLEKKILETKILVNSLEKNNEQIMQKCLEQLSIRSFNECEHFKISQDLQQKVLLGLSLISVAADFRFFPLILSYFLEPQDICFGAKQKYERYQKTYQECKEDPNYINQVKQSSSDIQIQQLKQKQYESQLYEANQLQRELEDKDQQLINQAKISIKKIIEIILGQILEIEKERSRLIRQVFQN